MIQSNNENCQLNLEHYSGDSYTATGFDVGGTQPSLGNPLGNPPYPGEGTSSNGILWIDVDTVKYNKTPVLTYNFAFGGATIDHSVVAANPKLKTMTEQVKDFEDNYVGNGNAVWNGDNSLFSIFIGINDIGNSWTQPNWSEYAKSIILQAAIKARIKPLTKMTLIDWLISFSQPNSPS